ncbi:VCBS repeat-containing protein [soil metagenome]
MRIFYVAIFFICIVNLFSCKEKTLFEKISSSQSGITFNNTIVENDSINPINLVNIYNGGGVGIGDFNNDGLQDIYFTGNMVSSKLYINKGNFKFDDITEKAGVDGAGRWARGVSIVDINNDGLMDIYIANTIYKDSMRRRNILYVNQGLDKDSLPHFKDMAAEYGLDIHVQSTMGNFFDYDNDGDLDMYLTVNEAGSENQNQFGKDVNPNKSSVGRLMRNDWDSVHGHPFFKDVSVQAGVTFDGIGHSATVADINMDGWKDIYVSDDFISDNILYINNHDGTFTNRSKEYFKHTSLNSMGQDIVDINNDGLSDVVELDMNPKDNFRKKMMMGSNNYNTIQNFEIYGHQYQYVRNTLQLNQGPSLKQNDSIGIPVFSEIGFMSGISQTDWSWTPLVVDFDNDGFRDMIVTNGFPRDVSDHDFSTYRNETVAIATPMQLLSKIPQVKLVNFAFKNNDGTSFKDVSAGWGMNTASFSNGAAYADLDNDGDMDMIVNNINDEAFVYENTLRKKGDTATHFLKVKCTGTDKNVNGIGTWIDIYYDGNKHQAYENTPYRGYLSSHQDIAHFGLGNTNTVDSVVIRWPNNKKQTLIKVAADQVLKVNIANANETYNWDQQKIITTALFKEITTNVGVNYANREMDFIDFNKQSTLPHKLSEYSPALAAGDMDGNGLDDLILGGNASTPAMMFLQQADGKFIQKPMLDRDALNQKSSKDEGLLLFDANGDNHLDLYVVSGGNKFEPNSPNYADRLYLNDGKGNFTWDETALPKNFTSKLCVKSMDYNGDGKPDIFVSGRLEPWHYPKSVSSFIYRNDTENGKVKFTDVTAEVAPDLNNIGMICDALFSDFDNDNKQDLILTGEWMPVTFLKNTGGKFVNVTNGSGIADKSGWWNSIVAGDFRHTGRTDYIVGNTGSNTLYQPTNEYPVYMTAKDFDKNGSYVPITSLFLPDKEGKLQEFPAYGRDDILERIPNLRKRYSTYVTFATATMEEVFPEAVRKDAQRLKANMLQSCYLRNDGDGKFTIIPLPWAAQISALNGMIADDYDEDGNLDILINGNDFSTEVSIGRLDALNGLLLKGDGKGNFSPLSILQSGIYIPGNGKALVKLLSPDGNYLVAASQHRSDLKIFQLNKITSTVPILPADQYALIKYKDGSTEKKEFYFGSSFLSQSARFIQVNDLMSEINITDNKGSSRKIIPGK